MDIHKAIKNNKETLTNDELKDYERIQTQCFSYFGREEKLYGNHIRNTLDDFLTLITQFYNDNYNLLDLGCGEGTALKYFKEKTKANLFGIDINPTKVNHLKDNLPNVKLQTGNIEFLNYPNNFFHVIHSAHVFEHCWNLNEVLNQVYKVLKSNGLFFVVVPFEPNNKNPKGNGNTHTHPFSTVQQIVNDFKNFNILKLEAINKREPEYAICMRKG